VLDSCSATRIGNQIWPTFQSDLPEAARLQYAKLPLPIYRRNVTPATVIYAASNDLKEEQLELFEELVAETLADDSFGHQKICPLIFRFENGKLVGALIVKQVQQ
jgi:hypothetical protein